jgi:hypothetical protein
LIRIDISNFYEYHIGAAFRFSIGSIFAALMSGHTLLKGWCGVLVL